MTLTENKKIMFHKFFPFFFGLLITGSLSAQMGTYTSINQTVPPSPTAASLGQYGDYVVKGFTGIPDIKIPLFDIQLKDFDLPISLSYAAGGVKVEDIASWVGLGWSLNSGGMITRSMVDKPDDQNDASALGILYNNWYKPGYQPNWSSFQNALDPFGGTSAPDIVQMLYMFRGYDVDTEPDIFYYNINGVAGKFMFNLGDLSIPLKQRIVLAPYRDISIDATLGSPDMLSQITITDEKGNRYFFADAEMSNITDLGRGFPCEYCYGDITNDFPGNHYHGPTSYKSAWYLTKIITVNNDEIDYTYANEEVYYDIANSKMGRMYNQSMTMTDAQGCAMDYSGFYNAGTIAEDALSMDLQGKRLTTITGPNFRVDFAANLSRQDINSQALTSVTLSTYVNNVISTVKQFNLTYHYMADLSHPQIQSGISAGFGDSRQHLLLDTLFMVDQSGTRIANYNFQYNSTVPLPDRLGPHKDFWGYFCNNQCNTAFPKLYIYPNLNFNPDQDNTYYPRYSVLPYNNYTGTSMVMPGANRNTDPVGILAGTLNQITFPTGGYTQFTFEPNTFNYYSQNYVGGGLRLKQTISYDGINHTNDMIKNYTYLNTSDNINSSGVLFNLPVFAYVENAWMHYPGTTNLLAMPSSDFYAANLVRSDVSQASLNGFDGVNVGYREITESQPGNGKIVRRYSVPGNFGMISDFTNDGACNINQSGFCDGYFQAPVPSTYTYYNNSCGSTAYPLLTDQSGTDEFTPYTFPFAPTPNYDWNRGLVLQESYYNNANTLQKSVNYTYQLFSPGNTGPQILTCLKKGRLLNYEFFQASGLDPCGLGVSYGDIRYDLLAPYQLLGQVAKVPSQIQTVEYDNNGNAFTSTKTYTYSFNSLLPSGEQTDRSDKSSTIVNTKYVTDLNLAPASGLTVFQGYQELLNSHVLYNPVEQYVQKKNTDNSLETVKAAFTTFKPGLPRPDILYSLRSAAPLTNFVPSSITSTAITKDSHYQPVSTFDSYDLRGNILQQTKVNDLSRSYLWDYNSMYPIADIQNAAQANVAYTSFEADGTGNWVVGSTSRVSGGITGSQSYSLSNGTISYSGLQPANTYIVSYWSNTGAQLVNSGSPTTTGMTLSGWTYYEHKITGTTTAVVTDGSSNGVIDELRLYPQGALMSTYTYRPMVGMTSSCDANNKLTYYEYDAFGRLSVIRDQERNILKTFKYQYQEQQ